MNGMPSTVMSVSMPPDLAEWVDEVRGDEGRSAFVCRALERIRGGSIAESAPARELPEPDKPQKYTVAELAKKRANYKRMGWELADFNDRRPPIEGNR